MPNVTESYTYIPHRDGVCVINRKEKILTEDAFPPRDPQGRYMTMNGSDKDDLWDPDWENANGPVDMVIRQDPNADEFYEAEDRYFINDDFDEDEPSDIYDKIFFNGEPLSWDTADKIGIQLQWDDPQEFELMILPQYEESDEFDKLPTRCSDSASARFPGLDVYEKTRIYRRKNSGMIGDRQYFVKKRTQQLRSARRSAHCQIT